MKDYYKILELSFGADISDVKKAYRRLALKYHPDKNKASNAAQIFIELTEAYEVLRDPYKKHEYDKIYEGLFSAKTKTEVVIRTEQRQEYESKQQEWTKFGKTKAQEYSSMPFDEFARRLLKEISIGVNYIPNVIGILFTVTMGITFLVLLPTTEGYAAGLPIMLILFSLGAFYLAYRLFIVAQADYKEERKRKIIKTK